MTKTIEEAARAVTAYLWDHGVAKTTSDKQLRSLLRDLNIAVTTADLPPVERTEVTR